LGHATASPKFAEHVTSASLTSSAVVCQVAVFVPVATSDPSFFIVIGTLAVPHSVTAQVKVTDSFPDADCRLAVQPGDVTAEK